MSKQNEALKLALEALERLALPKNADDIFRRAITAIKEALAQPEQSNLCGEPDWKGLVLSHNEDCESRCDMDRCGYKPYYEYSKRRCPDCPVHEKIWVDDTTPPQRTWVGLTDAEINKIRFDWLHYEERAKAIEAKLRSKNNG